MSNDFLAQDKNKTGYFEESLQKDDPPVFYSAGSLVPADARDTYNNRYNIAAGISKIPVLQFGNRQIKYVSDLITALESESGLSIEYLMNGILEKWAAKFNAGLACEIIKIKNSDYDEAEKVSALHLHLDPARPCIIEECSFSPYSFGPYTIAGPEDILELLRNEPEQVMDMMFIAPAYFRPDFYPWIDYNYPDLSLLLKNLRRKINQGLVPDLVLELRRIYLSLAGSRIKPFKNYGYEISSIDTLINIPEHDRDRVIEELRHPDSILYMWLFTEKALPRSVGLWESTDKTWDNLVKIVDFKYSSL